MTEYKKYQLLKDIVLPGRIIPEGAIYEEYHTGRSYVNNREPYKPHFISPATIRQYPDWFKGIPPQPSSIDRIEVTTCGHANWNEPNGGAFIFKTNKPIRYNDFPSEKIKQAIEAVLNGDTVVEDDIVGLLRDCVSSTWGNPSLDRTQELFDKFLLDRKLVNPTLKDVNKTVTKLVNEILLDKKYFQSEVDTIRRETWHACREWANGMWSNQLFPLGGNSQFKYPFIEDYLKSLSTPTTQPKEEDKPVIIEDNDRCGICGGEMVYIRGRYPNTDKRKVCPTCTTERLEQISDLCSPEYGKAYQNKN